MLESVESLFSSECDIFFAGLERKCLKEPNFLYLEDFGEAYDIV